MTHRGRTRPVGRCGLAALLPVFVDIEAAKGINATYELSVHGGACVIARFCDDTGTIHPTDNGSADCSLSGDAVAWLLALYGRVDWEDLLQSDRVTVTDGDATIGAGFRRLLRNP